MQLSSERSSNDVKVESGASTSHISCRVAAVVASITIALATHGRLQAELITVNFQGVATYQALDASQNGQFVNISSIMPFASGTAYTGIWTYDSTNGQGTLQHNVAGTVFQKTNAVTTVLNISSFDRLGTFSGVSGTLPTGWSSVITGPGGSAETYRLFLFQNPTSFLDNFTNTNLPTSFSLSDFTSTDSQLSHTSANSSATSVVLTTPLGSMTLDQYTISFSITQLTITAVPEPGSMCLVALAGVLVIGRRIRRK